MNITLIQYLRVAEKKSFSELVFTWCMFSAFCLKQKLLCVWPLGGSRTINTTLTYYQHMKFSIYASSWHGATLAFISFIWSRVSGYLNIRLIFTLLLSLCRQMLHRLQQLVANFVCLLFCAVEVAYCGFTELFSWKTAACCSWKRVGRVVRVKQKSKVWGWKTKTMNWKKFKMELQSPVIILCGLTIKNKSFHSTI